MKTNVDTNNKLSEKHFQMLGYNRRASDQNIQADENIIEIVINNYLVIEINHSMVGPGLFNLNVFVWLANFPTLVIKVVFFRLGMYMITHQMLFALTQIFSKHSRRSEPTGTRSENSIRSSRIIVFNPIFIHNKLNTESFLTILLVVSKMPKSAEGSV